MGQERHEIIFRFPSSPKKTRTDNESIISGPQPEQQQRPFLDPLSPPFPFRRRPSPPARRRPPCTCRGCSWPGGGAHGPSRRWTGRNGGRKPRSKRKRAPLAVAGGLEENRKFLEHSSKSADAYDKTNNIRNLC